MIPTKAADIVKTATEFCKMYQELNTTLAAVQQQIEELDRQQSTILHKFDKPTLPYKERNKLSTKLNVIRIERRQLKDWVHTTKPIFDFMASAQGGTTQNLINAYLGVCRRAEQTERQKEAGLGDLTD